MMKIIFLLIYTFFVLGIVYKEYQFLKANDIKTFVFSLFFVFLIVPDFLLFDAFGLGISWVFVLLFVCIIPVWYILKEGRMSIDRYDCFYLGFLLLVFLYAIYTFACKGYVEDYFLEKVFNYVYILLIPSIILVLFKKDVVALYPKWSRILTIAILAYAFKNFSLVGIVGFRDTYLAHYDTLKNVIFASRILGIGVLISVFHLKKEFNIFDVAATCIFFFQMLLFESRGPILAVVIAMLLIGVRECIFNFQKKQHTLVKNKSYVVRTITVIMVLVVLIIGTKALIESGSLMRIITKTKLMLSGQSEERSLIYPATIAAIKRLFPFGIGFGNSYKCLVGYGGSYQYFYPHNLFLEILLEEGLLGFLPFICFIIGTIYVFCTRSSNRAENTIWLTIYIFSMVNAMFSGDIAANNFAFLFGHLACANRILSRNGDLDDKC